MISTPKREHGGSEWSTIDDVEISEGFFRRRGPPSRNVCSGLVDVVGLEFVSEAIFRLLDVVGGAIVLDLGQIPD